MEKNDFEENSSDESKDENKEADLSFEKALEELEKVVHSLESGNLTLDESVAYFQKGINLTKICSKKLDEAEKKIEILVQDEEGEIYKEPFEIEEDK